jgi:DNA-binding XRE family transcriptional regulator
MVAMTRTKRYWDTRKYGDIVSARYEDGAVVVRFGDESEVRVPADRLAAPHIVAPDWPSVAAGDFWIEVPTATGTVEISWLAIRLLTDPAFSAYWDERCDEVARQVGERFKELRQERGVSMEALAQLVGASIETLELLEAGRLHHDLGLEDRLLAALGYTLDDLVEPQ